MEDEAEIRLYKRSVAYDTEVIVLKYLIYTSQALKSSEAHSKLSFFVFKISKENVKSVAKKISKFHKCFIPQIPSILKKF